MSKLALERVRPHPSARKERPLRHWSALLALVAAMLLAIAGGPTLASAAVCDPCPPDCLMMLGDSAAASKAPDAPADREGQAPCQQTVLCQAAPVVAPPPVNVAIAPFVSTGVLASWADSLEPPSRPPDRSLRPPILT